MKTNEVLAILKRKSPKRPMLPPQGCYVYGIRVNKVLRYIGKGTGFRAWSHFNLISTMLKAVIDGDDVPEHLHFHRMLIRDVSRKSDKRSKITVQIFVEDMSEQSAYDLEAKLIGTQTLAVENASHQHGLWNNGGRQTEVGRRVGEAEDAHLLGFHKNKLPGKRQRVSKQKRSDSKLYHGRGFGSEAHVKPTELNKGSGPNGKPPIH